MKGRSANPWCCTVGANCGRVMERFCSSVKRKYRERLINRQEQWPPCHGEKLIRLELVKRKRGESYVDEGGKHRSAEREQVMKDHQRKEDEERIPIAYSDLFKPEAGGRKCIRRVLVEGDAGIGKTTLCTSISEDWANEKLFQEFNLLLLLPLREKEVASAGSLSELLSLLHSSSNLRTVVANIIEEEEGENVLIVADGWDELSETERHDQSFLYKLLFGKLFPFASVLLTSRPFASVSLHKVPSIDRFVALHGFNKNCIKEYIQLEFADHKAKSDSLLDQLESNPLIESICSIPLNCAIICHLWRTLEEALPVTMTELYTKVIFNILLRNIRKSYPSFESITSFDTLPGNLSKSWWHLCKFAFLALARDSIVFSQDELIHFYPQGLNLDKEILCFGLLQYSKPILDTGYGMSFHFLHLTFQEYLAALHFVKQPLNNCLFESSMATKSHFLMVLRFSSGIFFKNLLVTYDIEAGIFSDILIHNYNTIMSDGMTACLELCHCAFEADYQPLTEKVIQLIHPYIPKPQSAHDYAAMLYLLGSINNHNNLEIRLKNCTSSKLTARLAEVLANKHERVQVTELSISGGNLTENDICLLFRRAASALQSIKSLKLDDNEISTTTFITTSPLMIKQCPYNLCSLNLSRNPLGVSGIQCLEEAIRAGSLFSLNDLIIQQTLTSDQDINGALLIMLCNSLSTHCLQFNHFDVSDNNLGIPGAQAIGSGLHHINTQQKGFTLMLKNTELYDEGVCVFISHLHCPCCLNCLCMSSNNISDNGASHLFQRISVSYNHIMLWKLDLSDNPISFEHILSLVTASSCSIGTLSLCKCWLTQYPMRDRPVTPQIVNIIKFLNLDENQFCKENIQILAKITNSCPNLEALSCCQCGITSDDLRYLLSQLSISFIRQLQAWWLNDNEIDDSGISALIECLPLFSLSCSFRIEGNPISSEMQERFYNAEASCKQVGK